MGKGTLIGVGGISQDMNYMVMEYAENGELFNYVSVGKFRGFSERIARPILRQMAEAVGACHKNGICHRDIKLENFMLDKDFNIKLCDFGFAERFCGPNNNFILTENLGTYAYKAPELWESMPHYSGEKADIFSLGATFFALLIGYFAFDRATSDNSRYSYICKNSFQSFWIISLGGKRYISNEFKDLFQKMVSLCPNNRPSINEILNHPWFQLENASLEEVINEFNQRKILL